MKKIGIMGGTFDPIHYGHLALGNQAYKEYGLQEVWFMPSGQPPHKKDHFVTEADNRLEMTRLAIQPFPYFKCSDFEISRQGNTYTAQTLALLKEKLSDTEIFFIIGADSLYEIEKWFHPEKVMSMATLLVAGREYHKATKTLEEQRNYLAEKYGASIYFLHCDNMDISSEEIRKNISALPVSNPYVPEKVMEYIRLHHLYKIMSSDLSAGTDER